MVATVSFLFDVSLLDPDPLKTLRDDVSEGKLGPFTVDPFFICCSSRLGKYSSAFN